MVCVSRKENKLCQYLLFVLQLVIFCLSQPLSQGQGSSFENGRAGDREHESLTVAEILYTPY